MSYKIACIISLLTLSGIAAFTVYACVLLGSMSDR